MRPKLEDTMLAIAGILSRRSTCRKLSVGCVLVDGHGKVLSAGYNGVPSGRIHCTDLPCVGMCRATHAESNALLSLCAPVKTVYACYVTHSPCMACVKQLVQTGCQYIFFEQESPEHDEAREFWSEDGREWQKWPIQA